MDLALIFSIGPSRVIIFLDRMRQGQLSFECVLYLADLESSFLEKKNLFLDLEIEVVFQKD